MSQSACADDINENDEGFFIEECYSGSLDYPSVNAISAIVIDTASRRILYEKNAFQIFPMASTTKIMTAILAIENSEPDDLVAISARAAAIGGSTIGYKKGQMIPLRELLYALMLNSGNDAAIAIAEFIGGDTGNFIGMMNKKADDIGARSTKFQSPHGLDRDGHYSTAHDLALITSYALENPMFADIVSTQSISMDSRTYRNTNELLGVYPGIDGVKTGYTGKAGRCLVASAANNGMRVVSVVLNSPTRRARAESSMKMLSYVFSAYRPVKILSSGEYIKSISIKRGVENQTALVASDELILPLKGDEMDAVILDVKAPSGITAPVLAAEDIGEVSVRIGDAVIAQIPLKTSCPVKRRGIFDCMRQLLGKWTGVLFNTD